MIGKVPATHGGCGILSARLMAHWAACLFCLHHAHGDEDGREQEHIGTIWGKLGMGAIPAAKYPSPRGDPRRCNWDDPPRGFARSLLCDPANYLRAQSLPSKRDAAKPGGDLKERLRMQGLLAFFHREFSKAHLGEWGITAGVAVVEETAEHLDKFAEIVMRAWQLDDAGGVLIVLKFGGVPKVAIAGGFFAGREEAKQEAHASALLRAGLPADAVEFVLSGVSSAATGGWPLPDPAGSGAHLEQKTAETLDSKFQKIEIWENVCAERRCWELFLGEVRQLSDRFEHYYHEAMAMPALNILGPSGARKVLVLGGGDGGVVTNVLKFDSVERVVLVEIDDTVTEVTRRWFPSVAAGLDDPRCEVIYGDAFKWAEEHSALEKFDLVIIDFTDDPLEGFWKAPFFATVKALLNPGGALVQNLGTMIIPESVHDVLRLHGTAFSKVYPMVTYIPDYSSPYILAFSTNTLDPLAVDWSFWERQEITTTYYSRALHSALFVPTADMARLLGLPLPWEPAPPSPISIEMQKLKKVKRPSQDPAVLIDLRTKNKTYLEVQRDWFGSTCQQRELPDEEACRFFRLNNETVVGRFTAYRDETMALPALNLLGRRARRLLVLGGGTGTLATLLLRWPYVEELIVIEIEAKVQELALQFFPGRAAGLADPRCKVLVTDALQWLSHDHGQFDAVFVNLVSEPWRNPSPTSRIPRTRRFVERLAALLPPHGILVQDIGSISYVRHAAQMLDLHRLAFKSVWALHYAVLEDDLAVDDELDARFRRPPWLLALSSPALDLDPNAVDWTLWQAAGISNTAFYHASMHGALFVLPAELQRSLSIPPPTAEKARPSDDGAAELATSGLVFSLVLEARGCSENALNDTALSKKLLTTMAEYGELTVLGELSYQFEPQGVTALLLVSESHISLHTWPEYGYAAIDVVSCKALPAKRWNDMKDAVRTHLVCESVTGDLSLRGKGVGAEEAGSHAAVRQDANDESSPMRSKASQDEL